MEFGAWAEEEYTGSGTMDYFGNRAMEGFAVLHALGGNHVHLR